MSPHIVLCLTRLKSWKDTKIARILYDVENDSLHFQVTAIAVKFDDVSLLSVNSQFRFRIIINVTK